MYKALYLSPMIPSFNLDETASFFSGVLGFSAEMHTDTYAIYQKDRLTVHILRAGPDIGRWNFILKWITSMSYGIP